MPQFQLLPAAPTFGSQLGQGIGSGLSQGIGSSVSQYFEQKKTRDMLESLFPELKQHEEKKKEPEKQKSEKKADASSMVEKTEDTGLKPAAAKTQKLQVTPQILDFVPFHNPFPSQLPHFSHRLNF